MDAQAPKVGSQSDFAGIDRESSSSLPILPVQAQFSLSVSLLCAAVILAALGGILWTSATLPRLDRVEEPERVLELMVGRMMEAQEDLRRSPRWQRRMTEWFTGNPQVERDQAIEWYRELVDATGAPLSAFRLAILQGESGYRQAALDRAATWQAEGASLSGYARFIQAAYGTAKLERPEELTLQAELAEVLPAGWFYNALAASLARRAHDTVLQEFLNHSVAVRLARRQGVPQALVVVEAVCAAIGSLMIVWLLSRKGRRDRSMRLHEPGVPPPWSGGIGVAVLLRGGALGAVLTLALVIFTPTEHVSLRVAAIPLTNLPLLALAYYYLLRPAGLTFANGFGLLVDRVQLGRLACVTLAAVAAGIWGEWAMGELAQSFHLANHWTEWFDADLVWGPRSVLAVSLLEYVVFAPVFEELAFRGLLYAILRRRFGVGTAAVISAGIFAAAHGYGWIGFASVFWSGVLWAWIYEKTGSLLPGMLAHAANNLLVCLSVMALLRG